MSARYEVFSETVGNETHWGVYDTETGSVVEWFANQDDAITGIPQERA